MSEVFLINILNNKLPIENSNFCSTHLLGVEMKESFVLLILIHRAGISKAGETESNYIFQNKVKILQINENI